MKLSYREIEAFVRSPKKEARVILVYGPDQGLVKERAGLMGKTVIENLNDPFNAVTLSTDILGHDPARLNDETGAMSMMGGDRLIRIEDGGDKLTTLIKDYLTNPSDNALIIIEAGELGTKSSLRKLCESAKNAAAVPCYIEDEHDLSRLIRETLQTQNIRIDGNALGWLTANIAGDRAKVRSELEKLITYKFGDQSPINLEDVRACCGEAGALALDDLVYATAGRQSDIALKTYAKLNEEGIPFIVILRSLQNHFTGLHITKAKMEAGENIDAAMKSLAPQVFFKQADAFKAQTQRWSLSGINTILNKLMDLEADCKKTGAPVDTLCAQTVLGISKARG